MSNAPFVRKITNADRRAIMAKAWKLHRKYPRWTFAKALKASWSDHKNPRPAQWTVKPVRAAARHPNHPFNMLGRYSDNRMITRLGH